MQAHFLNKQKNYVVAVSGGPDSMFLLAQLLNKGFGYLTVACVDYQKRIASKKEVAMVQEFCLKNNLVCMVKKVTPAMYLLYKQKMQKTNFQSIARYIRYDFFASVAKKVKACGVILAHNFSDHIETYLLQKKRQVITNYYGLRPTSTYQKITIIRPMLDVKRKAIEKYLKQHRIPFMIDASNASDLYERNVIRKSLSTLDLNSLALEIIEKNKNLAKLCYKDFMTSQGIDYQAWKQLSNFNQQRIIFYYLKKHMQAWLVTKKAKVIFEITKQMQTNKKMHCYQLNSSMALCKSHNLIYLQTTLD